MNKVIIRIPNHLGDAIMAQGAIRSFVEFTPDFDVHLLLPELSLPIYKDIKHVKFLPLKARHIHGPRSIYHQIKLLFNYHFGIGIVLTPSYSSALIMTLSGVQSRYGYDGEGRGVFLNNKIPKDKTGRTHRSERYYRLLERAAGHKLVNSPPQLTFSEKSINRASEMLIANGINPKENFITLGPQSVAPSRTWGIEKFIELVKRLDCQIVLIGSKSEFEAGEKIVGNCRNILNLCGQTDIETAGMIIFLSKLYIGNDSGLAHLAAAVGAHLVVLFGAGKPWETAPITDKKTLIIKDHLPCISCARNHCPLRGDDYMQCLRQITVEEVYNATQKYI
ncbi:MAG: lipopolysaccharide heptosyltransferase II [Candidatus Zixiibacteriota bacterium]